VKPAPITKRVYLMGGPRGYTVVIKDNAAVNIIWRLSVPTAGLGHAVVRAIRTYAGTRDGRIF
jgi:hypothetical protein